MITVSSSRSAKAGYHHGDLRAALLRAGLQILEEGENPSVLSLREAARRAGVSAMAPYRHFEDKDALLAALATVGFEMLGKALRDADAADAPEDALKGQGIAYVAFACDHPALFRLMFGAGGPTKAGALADASDASYRVLADRVAQVVPAGAAQSQSLANWALVHGLAMLAVDGQLSAFEATPAQLAADVLQVSMRRGPKYARPQ